MALHAVLADSEIPRGADEFRIAAGLASWSPGVLRTAGLLTEAQPDELEAQQLEQAAAPARRPRWPLALIATPAGVAIWSGWVGLGGMCGFGLVQPLPGIAPWHLDTAITLPVGIESYGAYALYAWLAASGISTRARAFARRSAIGAGLLGCLGQVAFHLMSAAGWKRAPWYVVMLVACLPVITLFFAATLAHLSRAADEDSAADNDPDKHSVILTDNWLDSGTDKRPASNDALSPDSNTDSRPDSDTDKPAASRSTSSRTRHGARMSTAKDKAAAIIRRNPHLSNAEVAERAGISEKTVQRARASISSKE